MAATIGLEPISVCLTGTHLTIRPSSNIGTASQIRTAIECVSDTFPNLWKNAAYTARVYIIGQLTSIDCNKPYLI